MGVFQRGINNLLGEFAIASKMVTDDIKMQKQQKEAINQQQQALEEAEKKSVEEAQNKIDEALKYSIGYSKADLTSQQAREDMGLQPTNKLPRGVSKKTYERRTANAQAMQKILTQYVQNADFRKRIEKYSSKEISKSINPEVRSRKVSK